MISKGRIVTKALKRVGLTGAVMSASAFSEEQALNTLESMCLGLQGTELQYIPTEDVSGFPQPYEDSGVTPQQEYAIFNMLAQQVIINANLPPNLGIDNAASAGLNSLYSTELTNTTSWYSDGVTLDASDSEQVKKNKEDILSLDGRVTINEGAISNLQLEYTQLPISGDKSNYTVYLNRFNEYPAGMFIQGGDVAEEVVSGGDIVLSSQRDIKLKGNVTVNDSPLASQADVNTNASNILQAQTDISALQLNDTAQDLATNANTQSIANNSGQINAVRTLTEDNKSDIESNSALISDNTANIQLNAADIVDIQDTLITIPSSDDNTNVKLALNTNIVGNKLDVILAPRDGYGYDQNAAIVAAGDTYQTFVDSGEIREHLYLLSDNDIKMYTGLQADGSKIRALNLSVDGTANFYATPNVQGIDLATVNTAQMLNGKLTAFIDSDISLYTSGSASTMKMADGDVIDATSSALVINNSNHWSTVNAFGTWKFNTTPEANGVQLADVNQLQAVIDGAENIEARTSNLEDNVAINQTDISTIESTMFTQSEAESKMNKSNPSFTSNLTGYSSGWSNLRLGADSANVFFIDSESTKSSIGRKIGGSFNKALQIDNDGIALFPNKPQVNGVDVALTTELNDANASLSTARYSNGVTDAIFSPTDFNGATQGSSILGAGAGVSNWYSSVAIFNENIYTVSGGATNFYTNVQSDGSGSVNCGQFATDGKLKLNYRPQYNGLDIATVDMLPSSQGKYVGYVDNVSDMSAVVGLEDDSVILVKETGATYYVDSNAVGYEDGAYIVQTGDATKPLVCKIGDVITDGSIHIDVGTSNYLESLTDAFKALSGIRFIDSTGSSSVINLDIKEKEENYQDGVTISGLDLSYINISSSEVDCIMSGYYSFVNCDMFSVEDGVTAAICFRDLSALGDSMVMCKITNGLEIRSDNDSNLTISNCTGSEVTWNPPSSRTPTLTVSCCSFVRVYTHKEGLTVDSCNTSLLYIVESTSVTVKSTNLELIVNDYMSTLNITGGSGVSMSSSTRSLISEVPVVFSNNTWYPVGYINII